MSWIAKACCSVVISAGAAVFLQVMLHLQSQSTDGVRLIVCLLSARILATLKLHVPGMKATVSGGCVVIFTGVAGLTIAETVLIGVAAGIGQCFWRTRSGPNPVQVVFSIATLVVSSAVTWESYHWLAGVPGLSSPSGLILSAAAIYYLTNTAIIAGVLAVTEMRPPMQNWKQLYLWTFPHYVFFAILGGFINDAAPNVNWLLCLVAMPLLGFMNHARIRRAEAAV